MKKMKQILRVGTVVDATAETATGYMPNISEKYDCWSKLARL
jgi:hypothetical protein